MRASITAFLLLLLVSLNAVLGTRLVVGDPIPPMGRFLSPQEGFWRNAEPLDLVPPTQLRITGLSAPVEVVWDEVGVPHLFARNDTDLYRAQGYILASLRLWQFDFIARAAEGRISEVIGENALEFDRGQRRKGMRIGAEASAAALEADSVMRPLLRAYADGYNQYLATLGYRDLPVEYKLLAYRPEPWSPLRSALVQQYMIDNLSGWDRDVENTNALAVLGPELFELIFPERPPGVVPTVPTDAPWSFVPRTMEPPAAYDPLHGALPSAERSDPSNGSNNWAVHGSRTRSGRPLLANDTHLGLNFPPIWVPVQLATPDHRVFGFTIPGACGIIIGHNDHAAWGVTNAPRDTRDHFRITWKDATRSSYLHDGQWEPVQFRVETFKVRGADAFVDTLRITRHGPVVADGTYGKDMAVAGLAMRWLGHDASMTQRALHAMNRVQGHADYVEALRWFHAPAQNWVFASVDGTVAMRVQGRFPNKWKGQGKFILDGAEPSHLWQGWIPFEHTATQVDPERGFVSSANQHSVDEAYPYWFYHGHLEYYRNRSVNSSLWERKGLSPEDMMTMQHSGYDLRAAEGLRAMLPLLDTMALDSLGSATYSMMRDWDHVARHDAEEAALFHEWFDRMRELLWEPLAQGTAPLGEPTPYNTIRILADSTLRTTVERGIQVDAREAVNKAFILMLERRVKEGSLLWRSYNNARVTHLARLPAFSVEQLPVNGCGTAINAQRGNHGPSQRIVVDLTSPPTAWYQLPGGISGAPGSRHYDDLLQEWHTGSYRPVHFLASAAEGRERGFTLSNLVP